MATPAIVINNGTIQFGMATGAAFTPDGTVGISYSAAGAIAITGNLGTLSASITGNAATATSAAACTGNAATASIAASCTGNAATATLAAAASNVVVASIASAGTYYLTFVNANSGSLAPFTSPSLKYNPATGDLTASIISNAIWNDVADFLEIEKSVVIQSGKAYVYKDGVHRLSQMYAEEGILGLASDTYGFGVGKKAPEINQLPLAIAGIVLAFVDNVYPPGTPLTCTEGGYLTKMKFFTKMFYPERMIATFYKQEFRGRWNGVDTKGRDWVKIV